MKKKLLSAPKIALIALLLLSARLASGQVIFTSTPDSIAVLNELYTYDVEAASSPNAPVYSLEVAPAGMSINASSGLITWTPTSLTLGGMVKVKAVNSAGTYYQTYYIYITNAVSCDEAIISYWPLDAKTAQKSVIDYAGGYNGLWEGAPGPEPTLTDDAMVDKAIEFIPTSNLDWGYNINDENQYDFKGNMPFSISFWFKNKASSVVGVTNKEVIVGRWAGAASGNAGFNVQWNPVTWRLEFRMRDTGGTDTTLVSLQEIPDNDNEWHHVVAAFYPDPANDSYMHLFVDGVHTSLRYDFWLDDFSGTEDAYLGYNYNYEFPFSGLLDEVAIWNKELVSSDVSSLRSKGLAGTPLCQEGDVAPIITSVPVTTGTEDIDYSYKLTYRAMAGHTVTMSAPTLPSWLSFNSSTGMLTGKPLNANSGNHNVTLRITEGSINVDQSFTINVTGVNDPPVFTTTPGLSAITKQQYTYIISATDEEGQALTITCPTKPAWLAFSATAGNGVLIGTPQRTDAGTANVTVQVTDGTTAVPQNFSIVVTLDNNVPVITSTAVTSGMTDVLYTYTITATDADAEALTYSAPTLPAWLNFNSSTHVLSGIPAQANLGTHNVVLEVTDGKDPVQQSFTINVVANGINDKVGSLAKVYPVPSSDFVIMEFAERLGKADLQILSTSGELMKRIDISNLSSYRLDVRDLRPTYYIYRIVTSNGQQTGSIIVQ
jgi:hypothetical protein